MAMMAIRTFRKSSLKQWIRCSFSSFSTARDRPSDLSSAFWDPEGATIVGEDQKGNLDYLKKDPIPKVALASSEIIRWTNFGHVRLDRENPAVEAETQSKQEEDALNYVDQQFFGNMRNTTKEEPQVEKTTLTASDVPFDTNPIDQQYFYPNSKSDTKLPTPLNNIPSAEELDFKENQIDDQYFGKSSREGLFDKDKPNPNKLPALEYLRSLHQAQKSAEGPAETARSTKTATLGKDGGVTESSNKGHDDLIPNFRKMSKEVIAYHLKKSVLYNKDGIVAIDKPYGMATTDVDDRADIVLTHYLPILSKLLKCEELLTVHRLDRDTTGVLLLASNREVADRLNKLFFERAITKKYLALTKGIPNPREGVIDIPICEKDIDGRKRMGLRPVKDHQELGSAQYNARSKSSKAITNYRVVRSAGQAALVELEPETGVRHQLRVHLSEAINCQVLGDHKYAHPDRFAPQKLPIDLLESLGIRQSKARNIPMHLHATSLTIPGFGENGEDLMIHARLPAFFRLSIKKLKFYSEPNKKA